MLHVRVRIIIMAGNMNIIIYDYSYRLHAELPGTRVQYSFSQIARVGL